MDKKLIRIIACPKCKGDLELQIFAQEKDEVLEGMLRCNRCLLDFEIKRAVPHLLAKEP
jgi:uncharacterized protein